MRENPFEQQIAHEREKDYIHPAVEHAHNKAHGLLEASAIDPHDFVELYGEANVTRDLAAVEKKEAGFKPEANKVYAEVLEAIMYHQIGHGDWFGKDATTMKSSKYDDYFNGSDLILELTDLEEKLSHLSLSIDVTFGTATEQEKFSKIKENIDQGTLGKLKYFNFDQKGPVKIPQVIIGVEKDLVVKLAGLWSDESTLKTKSEATLKDHPVQRVILSEIFLQLQVFRNYAESTGKDNLVSIFEKDLKIIESILREKGFADIGDLRNDKVFAAIREGLKVFKK